MFSQTVVRCCHREVSQTFKPRRSNARRSSFYDLLWDRNPPSYSHAPEWIPGAEQQWIAKDGSTAAYFVDICAQFERLQQHSPNYGFLPESSKEILVVAPYSFEQAKVEFTGLNFLVETVSRCKGGATESQLDRKQSRWLGEQHWKVCNGSTCQPTKRLLCSPARMAVSTTHNTKNWIMLWSAREGYAGRVSPGTFWRSNRWRRLPACACPPYSDIFWTGSIKHSQFRNADSTR